MEINTSSNITFSYKTTLEEEVQIQQNAAELVQKLLVPFANVVVKIIEKSLDLDTSVPAEVVVQNQPTLFTKGGCPNKSEPKPGSKPGHEYGPNWAEGIE